jgi:hypothetical protein
MTLGEIVGSRLLNGLRKGRSCASLPLLFASGMLILSAQTTPGPDFAALIKTPANLQTTLEHCDGHPDFETALANWLEAAEPSSPADREAVHRASLRLLEDTTDRQLVLSLGDGLLRHALQDLKRDHAIVPEQLAQALYADIGKAVRRQRSKAKAITVPAYSLADDGTVKDERQASFLEKFLNLNEPGVAHSVAPSRRQPGDSARSSREQAERKSAGSVLPAGMHSRQ